MDYPEIALAMLKANLGYYDSSIPLELEKALQHKLIFSRQQLLEHGITIDDSSINDCFLLAMYAEWVHRKGPEGAGKSEMLKFVIQQRQLSQALAAGGAE